MPAAGLREALAAAETDRIVYDLTGIEEHYDHLIEQLPGVDVRFAVKACPVDEVIATLAARGAGCDAASPNEIAQALRAGVPAERIHYGNTSKSDRNIADAYAAGVRDFATDSVQDVTAIGGHAPGSRVFCRVATTGEGALWGLSRKFGCSVADAVTVLTTARELGLTPAGLSIHVGSQQMRPGAWRAAFEDLARVVGHLRELGVHLRYVNLGGGLPALGYLNRHGEALEPPLDKIFATIRDGMQQLSELSESPLRFIAEPGRYLVADHGAIRAHVQRLSERELLDGQRQHWLYLSVGKYNGLYEMDELQYRLVFPTHQRPGGERETVPHVPVVVAGPTCDSDDAFVHDDSLVRVPAALESGDPVWILSCGAYATSYTTQGFNGIDPLPQQLARSPRVRAIRDDDWPRIAQIEHEAYAPLGLSEGEPALRAWARMSPGTCFVLELDGAVAGYVLALPHPPGEPPALGRPDPVGDDSAHTNLHLHDLALAGDARGKGHSELLRRRLEQEASARMFETIGLVAVGGSRRFWAAAGFTARGDVAVPEGYGTEPVYMSKSVEADQLAAYPR